MVQTFPVFSYTSYGLLTFFLGIEMRKTTLIALTFLIALITNQAIADLPIPLRQGMPYSKARAALIDSGWQAEDKASRAVGTISVSVIVRMSFIDGIPPIMLSLIGATRLSGTRKDYLLESLNFGRVFSKLMFHPFSSYLVRWVKLYLYLVRRVMMYL
jgi:hypothetical protein